MSNRVYALNVFDDKINQSVLFINSQIQPFQLVTSVTYSSLDNTPPGTIIELYNVPTTLNLKRLLNCKLDLYAGTVESTITNMIGVNANYISPDRIISGYIYDAIYDWTAIPNRKLVIKVNPIPSFFSKGVAKGRNIKDSTINIVCNKGSDILKFVTNVAKTYANIELQNGSFMNAWPAKQDFVFSFDPRRTNVLYLLNNFLKNLAITSDVIPITIAGTPSGYAIIHNLQDLSVRRYGELMKMYLKIKEKSFEPDASNEYKVRYTANRIMNALAYVEPLLYNIPISLMVQPPLRTNVNTIQITTILMPHIKQGDLVKIGNMNGMKTFNLGETPVIKNFKSSAAESYSGMSGSFIVQTVHHNLNYFESSKNSWLTVIELIQYPESEEVKYSDMYS